VPASAELNEDVVAYQRGDFDMAMKELLPLAKQGDAMAQFMVGSMHHTGQGVPQDYAETVRWLRLAAEKGDGAGQAGLGNIYGELQAYTEARKWFRLAAEQGNSFAQAGLGIIYRNG